MTDPRLLSPRGGRLLGVLGIVLLALTIRTAVAGLAPLAERIDADIPLDASALGLLGGRREARDRRGWRTGWGSSAPCSSPSWR